MSSIPQRIEGFPRKDNQALVSFLKMRGWRRIHRGKVRDTYAKPSDPDRLVVVATDRLSIYDFVLPVLVPKKGDVLTALTHFWLTQFGDIENHLLPERPDPFFPAERSLVVRKVHMQSYELIFRYHIGGSAWSEYRKNGSIGGIPFPSGLTKWQKLDSPLFTPSTKAETGHDLNIKARDYFSSMGSEGARTLVQLKVLYEKAYDYASARGIILLDTKFEAGAPFVLADEVLTPDSSRFTLKNDLKVALVEGRDPVFYDKQLVREWGKSVPTPFGFTGLDSKELDPENLEHIAFVHGLEVPPEIIAETSHRYLQLFELLTGETLSDYQRQRLNKS